MAPLRCNMVELLLENPRGKFPARLVIKGHAGYGNPGEDVVCAAVSTLFYTAVAIAEEMEEQGQLWQPPKITASPGFGVVEFCPKPRFVPMATAKMETLATGLGLLGRYYPKYVARAEARALQ